MILKTEELDLHFNKKEKKRSVLSLSTYGSNTSGSTTGEDVCRLSVLKF
jgi:hypothetical protein